MQRQFAPGRCLTLKQSLFPLNDFTLSQFGTYVGYHTPSSSKWCQTPFKEELVISDSYGMEFVRGTFLIVVLFSTQWGWANQYSDDAVAEWSMAFVEEVLVDNELICDQLNLQADYYETENACIPITPKPLSPVQSTVTDPYVQELLDAEDHAYEWAWAKEKILEKQKQLDFQINYYQELRNAIELAEDDFNSDSQFTQEFANPCNLDGDLSSEEAHKQSNQLFESFAIANQLYHSREQLREKKRRQCGTPHARQRNLFTKPSCDDLQDMLDEMTQGLEGLYVAHPILTSDATMDLIKEKTPEEFETLSYEEMKQALSSSAFAIQKELEVNFIDLNEARSAITAEDQKKYLRSASLLRTLAPSHWIHIQNRTSYPRSVKQVETERATCRLYQRQDKIEVAEVTENTAYNMALTAGPLASVKLMQALTSSKAFTALAPKANLSGGTIDATTFVGASTASIGYQVGDLAEIYQMCDQNLNEFAQSPTCESGAERENCNAMMAKQMAIAGLFVAAEAVGLRSGAASAKLSREQKLLTSINASFANLSTSIKTSLTQRALERNPKVKSFKEEYAGEKAVVSESDNAAYIKQADSGSAPEGNVVYEHEFSRLKKCNDNLLKDKELCTALDSFFYERFSYHLGYAGDASNYGDYKIKGVSAAEESVPSEQFTMAFQRAIDDMKTMINEDMPEVAELFRSRGQGVDASLDHLFSAGMARGSHAHDKATIAARIGRATSTSDVPTPHSFESPLVQNRLNNRRSAILNSTEDFQNIAQSGTTSHLDAITVDGETVYIPSVRTIEILRKVKTPRIRVDKRPKGASTTPSDMGDAAQADSFYDEIYIDEVRKQIKNATGADLSSADAVSLISYYQSLDSLSLGPRFSGRTPINYENGGQAFISMDIKGMGARNLHELGRLYAQAGSRLNPEQMVQLSRQAEVNVTAALDTELNQLVTEVSQLPDSTLARLSGQDVENLSTEQRLALAQQTIQRTGDDIVITSQNSLSEADLRALNQNTSRGTLEGQYRATYVNRSGSTDASGVSRRIEKNEEYEKAFQKRLLAYSPPGQAPKLDIMVVRQSPGGSRVFDRVHFVLPKDVPYSELRNVVRALRSTVPGHRRGLLFLADGRRVRL